MSYPHDDTANHSTLCNGRPELLDMALLHTDVPYCDSNGETPTQNGAVDKFEAEILKLPQVLECHLMAGDWDYVLRVVVRDLEQFRDFHMNFLSKIPGVGNVKSNISMKQVKYSTALSLVE